MVTRRFILDMLVEFSFLPIAMLDFCVTVSGKKTLFSFLVRIALALLLKRDIARKLKRVLLKAPLKIMFVVIMMPKKLLLMRTTLVLMYMRGAELVIAEKFTASLRTSLYSDSMKKAIYI